MLRTKGNLFPSSLIKKGWGLYDFKVIKGYGNRLSSQGFKKGLLIKLFAQVYHPGYMKTRRRGAISSYQGTIKQVWVSAERNFIRGTRRLFSVKYLFEEANIA